MYKSNDKSMTVYVCVQHKVQVVVVIPMLDRVTACVITADPPQHKVE